MKVIVERAAFFEVDVPDAAQAMKVPEVLWKKPLRILPPGSPTDELWLVRLGEVEAVWRDGQRVV